MLKFTIGLIIIYKIELIADKDQNNTYLFENLWIHKYYFGLCQQSILFYIILKIPFKYESGFFFKCNEKLVKYINRIIFHYGFSSSKMTLYFIL